MTSQDSPLSRSGCSHCLSKFRRGDYKPPNARSNNNLRDRLQPHLVTIETKEDFLNNQRCLYFDKLAPQEAADVEEVPDLELLKQEIMQREQELEVISDANKVTADQMARETVSAGGRTGRGYRSPRTPIQPPTVPPDGASAQAPFGSPFDSFEQDQADGARPGRLGRDRASGIGDGGGSIKEVHLVVNPGQPIIASASLAAPRTAGPPARMSKTLRDPVSTAGMRATGKQGQAGGG